MITLLIAALALAAGLFLAVSLYQDRVVAKLKKALEVQARATSREHARAEVLQADLDHLARTARMITLWRYRKASR